MERPPAHTLERFWTISWEPCTSLASNGKTSHVYKNLLPKSYAYSIIFRNMSNELEHASKLPVPNAVMPPLSKEGKKPAVILSLIPQPPNQTPSKRNSTQPSKR